jgi:SAM-dependent methyltransferase
MDGVMPSPTDAPDTFLRFPRQKLLQMMPAWLRDRIDLHHTRISELVQRASRSASPGQRILDAGAGEGRYRSHFEHLRYVGIDLAVGDPSWDYSALDVAGDLLKLPFADQSFDLALCLEVLEHIREPQQMLRELYRVLRPGGRLYFSVPMSWHQHQKPHDYYRYTSFGLRYLLDQAGFNVEALEPTGGYFWFLSIQFQMLSVWVFPPRQRRWQRLVLMPVKIICQLFFFVLLPLLFYYLDRLDHHKDQTMAWTGIARRR